MTEITTPGEPGYYLTNNVELATGSVMRTEDADVEQVTWMVFHARGTDQPDNTVVHIYAINDDQLVATINMLIAHARRQGLSP